MAEKKTTPENEKEETVEEQEQAQLPSPGEFFEPPTVEAVLEFLKEQVPVGLIDLEKYAAYVLPLSQSKNISIDRARPKYVTVWTMYFTVAGRVKMFNDDMALRGLTGVVEPDPRCFPPGWVYRDGERLVYRVKVSVYDGEVCIGERYGTAWVPWSGGGGAVKTNRFEKVETSATGRALAAWGYGVLPGSGIASFEEMIAMQEYGAIAPEEKEKKGKRSRAEIEEELNLAVQALADAASKPYEGVLEAVQAFAVDNFSANVSKGWSKLKEGELLILLAHVKNKIKEKLGDEGVEEI